MAVNLLAIFDGTAAQIGPAGPLDVDLVASSYGNGPRLVSNPGGGSPGRTLVFISNAPSPGIEAAGSWAAPSGATAIPDAQYDGVSFVPRYKAWTKTDAGEANFTFGYTGSVADVAPQTSIIVALDGLATDIRVTPTPVVSTATSTGYPGLTTVSDMLVLAIACQQAADELTLGPSDALSEVFNNTGTVTPRGTAIHKLRATGDSISPNPATWDASSAAHVQWLLGFAGAGGTSSNSPVDPADFTVYVDPTDPSTWDENRPDGQLIVAGNRFNTGQTTDDIQAGTGYGLAFDTVAPNEIHGSFTMEDGDTLRFGPRSVTGLQHQSVALLAKHQWVNGNGYNEAAESGGINLSTAISGPFASDRTFFDGTRTQLALIPTSAADPKAIRGSYGGATGDRVLQTSCFRIADWMRSSGDSAAGGGCHASGSAPSPWTQFMGSGSLRIITRDKPSAPWSPTNTSWTGNTRRTIPIGPADVGNWWAIIYDYKIDPLDGFLHVYLNQGSGWSQILDLNNGYGLSYANSDVNQSLWYAILCSYYTWHRYTNGPVNNWDNTYGEGTNRNVRTMAYAYAGVIVNPTTVDLADLQSHGSYYLEG